MELTKQRAKIVDLQTQLAEHREYKQLLVQEKLLEQKLKNEQERETISWRREATNVRDLSLAGKTLQEIGDFYGVTRARIGQVLQKYFPELTSDKRGKSLLHAEKRRKYLSEVYKKRDQFKTPLGEKIDKDLSTAMSSAFIRKRQNAKRGKWEWLLSPTDITYPTHCPMLGIELDWFSEFKQENSPSFDRVDSTKGYIPGNVLICSWRANRIKNDGTASELRKIADFLDKYNTAITDTQEVSVVQ